MECSAGLRQADGLVPRDLQHNRSHFAAMWIESW
jgi:hypothetical protein